MCSFVALRSLLLVNIMEVDIGSLVILGGKTSIFGTLAYKR